MVVICPKCKTKLKVDEGKISAAGSRFKCPKCSTILLVKKPALAQPKAFHYDKILVAHSNATTVGNILGLLKKHGYQAITAADGIEAMVKTIRELPFLVITEVGLPKIFGFEICKRLKARPETKGIKFILVSTPYDKNRYKRDPESLYEADDFIEEHSIPELLIDSINTLKGEEPARKESREKEQKVEEKVVVPPKEPAVEKPAPKPEPSVSPPVQPSKPTSDETIERAKRLARTIVSDIYLYNTPKAEAAIKNNRFYADFASELKEGLKLYENRIPQEVRAKGDFFQDTIRDFIENKKKSL